MATMAIGLSGGILSTSTLAVIGSGSTLLLLPIPPQWLQIGYSPQYTYLLGDARTGQVIAELPLWSVSFDRRLKVAGSFRGSLTLGDPRITNTGWLTALDEGRTKIWVDRDGQLLWDGIAWTSGYSSETRVLDIGGSETWSYLTHRFVHDSLAFTQVDQLAIVRDLLAYAQGRPLAYATGAPLTFPQPGGDVNIAIAGEMSGVLRNLSINWWDYQAIDDVISKLAALDNGFDYSVDAAYATGQPRSMLNLSYPRRGTPAQRSGLVFAYGESVIDYVWRRDGTQRAFTNTALGQGSGEKMLHSTASVTSWIDNGFPALERVSSHKDIDDPARLAAIATSEAAAFAKPIDLVTLIVNPLRDPPLGSFTVGDDVRLQITDERFPNPGLGGLNQSLDIYMRITGYQVTPSDSGPERVEVSLGATLV